MKNQKFPLLFLIVFNYAFLNCEQKSLYDKWHSDSFSSFENSFFKVDKTLQIDFFNRLSNIELEHLAKQFNNKDFNNNLSSMVFSNLLNQEYEQRNIKMFETYVQNSNPQNNKRIYDSINKILIERKIHTKKEILTKRLFLSDSLNTKFDMENYIYLNNFSTSQLLKFKDHLITFKAIN